MTLEIQLHTNIPPQTTSAYPNYLICHRDYSLGQDRIIFERSKPSHMDFISAQEFESMIDKINEYFQRKQTLSVVSFLFELVSILCLTIPDLFLPSPSKRVRMKKLLVRGFFIEDCHHVLCSLKGKLRVS